jgi:hypothetical protein
VASVALGEGCKRPLLTHIPVTAGTQEEGLGSRPGAKSLHNSFGFHNQPVWRDDLSSDELAFDHFEVTLIVVATTATRNGADIDEHLPEWDHLQIRVSVAGRWGHGGVLPTGNSTVDWCVRSSPCTRPVDG